MNKDRKKITLLRPNGKRMIRFADWPEKHPKIMKQLKLTVLDAPESKAAEIEKELEPLDFTDAPYDENFNAKRPPLNLPTEPKEETETIEQAADEIVIDANVPDNNNAEFKKEFAKNAEIVEISPYDLPATNGQTNEPLTIKEGATYAGISYQKFAKLVRLEKVPTVPGDTPKQKRVLKSDIDKYLHEF